MRALVLLHDLVQLYVDLLPRKAPHLVERLKHTLLLRLYLIQLNTWLWLLSCILSRLLTMDAY